VVFGIREYNDIYVKIMIYLMVDTKRMMILSKKRVIVNVVERVIGKELEKVIENENYFI